MAAALHTAAADDDRPTRNPADVTPGAPAAVITTSTGAVGAGARVAPTPA
ncbi:hypothetical protein ND486_25855 [Pseudonocardia sp. DR1-2]|nr:hypothetical protein [Pseudonocardia sp. DR1-2]MCM3849624.1 hypothetical protein [Pseudonocardia sp. DR1-2]